MQGEGAVSIRTPSGPHQRCRGRTAVSVALGTVRRCASLKRDRGEGEFEVHTYQHRPVAEGSLSMPRIADYRFTSAHDVVAYASADRTIGWASWPAVWHLDDGGALTCYEKASSLCSLKRWAEDPRDLYRSRQAGLEAGGCGADWLVVDSRPRWHCEDGVIVDEGDAEAFVVVRKALDLIGVRLVDAVVFDDDCHWWSMRELTLGETSWARGPDC
jgi:hypothetical protein